MKKLIYCAAALATALFAGSCQRELLDPAGGNGTVTYTVQVPEIGTKALGDDVTVINDLVYAVYRTTKSTLKETLDNWDTATHLVYDKNVEGQAYNEGKTTVSLELINNQNYVILFWAQKDDAWVAGEDFDLTKITYPADTEGNVNMVVNIDDVADKYAAFSGVEFLAAGDFAGQHTATLTRPFAQINIAAKDPDNYDVTVTGATVTVKEAGDQFNVATQLAATKKNQVVYTWTTKPESTEFAVNGVAYEHYVAMNYVFAYDNVKVAYDINTENHGTVSNEIINVPVAKNYRTNIVGKLLTSMVDYSIELDNNWGPEDDVDDDKVVSVWDGSSISEPTCIENTYTINTAEELAWVAAAVNGTLPETRSAESISFSGKTVVLAADINLNGKEWTPIGLKSNNYAFKGTFDGANHTVSNFYVNNEGYAGLFGQVYVGTVNNLTVKDVTIVSNHYAGAIVGQGYVNMENCHVENVNITLSTKNGDWGDKAGGIIGQNCEGAKYIKNSSAKNVTITGYRDLGGIAGMAHKNNIVSGCSVENITITQDLSVNYEDQTPTTVGAVVGRVGSNATIENNEVVGGIVIEKLVNSQKAFEELVQTDGTIVLNNGEYNIPLGVGNSQPGSITVIGNGVDTKLKGAVNSNAQVPGNYAHSKHLVFKNLTYVTANNGYNGGFGHAASVTFINCTIIGQFYAHSEAPHYFYNCTIDPLTGYLYTYGSDCVFERCTFSASEGKALQVYGEGDVERNVLIKNCEFKAAKQAVTWDNKPVTGIDINSANGYKVNVTVENCTTTGFPTGLNSGSDLYNIKDGGLGKVTLTIDGVCVVRAGYSKLANYPNIWVKDNNYYVFDKAGLAELNAYFAANWCGNDTWNHEYHIGADIDATGFTWNGVYLNVGWNGNNGLVLDGNNHTISNMTINNYMLSGTPTGGNEGTTPGYVKDITMKDVTVNGSSHDAAVFWGNCYTNVNFENVTVDGAKIYGGSNVGALISRTSIENNPTEVTVNFTDCKVSNSTLKADNLNADPTGASGFIGRAYSKTKLTFSGCSVENNTIINADGLVGGKVYGYTTWYGNGFTGTGACDTFTNWNGIATVNSEDALKSALIASQAVVLTDNITVANAWDARYTGGKTSNPVVIDGNGKTLKFTNSVIDNNYFAVFRFEDTASVKNLTIDMSEATNTAQMRAISCKSALSVDNCTFIGKANINSRGIIYGEGAGTNKDFNVSITNSVFVDWKRGVTDNENAQDMKSVTVENNTFNNASVNLSAYDSIVFNKNDMVNSYVDLRTYTPSSTLTVTAQENTLDSAYSEKNIIKNCNSANIDAQDGFTIE